MERAGDGTFELKSTMRAMRRLKPDPVPDEILARLVEAATWAPSAANIQGFSFVVVTDRRVMARVAELWIGCAPARILGRPVGAMLARLVDDPGPAELALPFRHDGPQVDSAGRTPVVRRLPEP